MSHTPLPVFVPDSISFRLLLEPLSGDGPRQFRPIRAGRFVVSIQASEANASSPPGAPPPEDVDAFEVAIFTTGADGEQPSTVSPASHPHLFRDSRWAKSWVAAIAEDRTSTYWSGRFIPIDVVTDLLTCLCNPGAYAYLLSRGIIPPQPPT
jgi:hypothetical protein